MRTFSGPDTSTSRSPRIERL